MRIANKNASNYIRNRLTFTGSNLFGKSIKNGYVVYSYGYHYPLFVYSWKAKKWYGNSDKYSISTSKHKSQCGIHDHVSKGTAKLQEIIQALS